MNIVRQNYLYELLVRGGPDGGLAGAHQIFAERVLDADTGEVLSERQTPAQPLDPAHAGSVVGEHFATLASELAKARGEIERLEGELAAQSPSRVGAGAGETQ